jgi:hypothetical protein
MLNDEQIKMWKIKCLLKKKCTAPSLSGKEKEDEVVENVSKAQY